MYTAEVSAVFETVSQDYGICSSDLPELLRTAPIIQISLNDWTVFFDRIQEKYDMTYSEKLQIFLDFIAAKSEKQKINLQQKIIAVTLTHALPDIRLSNILPFEFGTISDYPIGFIQIETSEFVVFSEHSLFWIDCKKELLSTAMYSDAVKDLPHTIRNLIAPAMANVLKLGFVSSNSLVLPSELSEYAQRIKSSALKKSGKQNFSWRSEQSSRGFVPCMPN